MLVLLILYILLRDLDVNIRRPGLKLTSYKRGYIIKAYIINILLREIKLII
jgi:hypothetical protein